MSENSSILYMPPMNVGMQYRCNNKVTFYGQLEKQGRERERETKICAKLPGQRQLVALGYCLHESQGRVGLRTHGSLTLFTRRTRKNCGGEGTTINSIVVRVKYPFSSHYSQDCTSYAAQNLLNPFPPLDGCQDRIG